MLGFQPLQPLFLSLPLQFRLGLLGQAGGSGDRVLTVVQNEESPLLPQVFGDGFRDRPTGLLACSCSIGYCLGHQVRLRERREFREPGSIGVSGREVRCHLQGAAGLA